MIENREDDDENGIYVELLGDIVYLRQHDISEENFNHLELADNHYFFLGKHFGRNMTIIIIMINHLTF